jgi:hypothetical protein
MNQILGGFPILPLSTSRKNAVPDELTGGSPEILAELIRTIDPVQSAKDRILKSPPGSPFEFE